MPVILKMTIVIFLYSMSAELHPISSCLKLYVNTGQGSKNVSEIKTATVVCGKTNQKEDDEYQQREQCRKGVTEKKKMENVNILSHPQSRKALLWMSNHCTYKDDFVCAGKTAHQSHTHAHTSKLPLRASVCIWHIWHMGELGLCGWYSGF